jgi:hypothetical protein
VAIEIPTPVDEEDLCDTLAQLERDLLAEPAILLPLTHEEQIPGRSPLIGRSGPLVRGAISAYRRMLLWVLAQSTQAWHVIQEAKPPISPHDFPNCFHCETLTSWEAAKQLLDAIEQATLAVRQVMFPTFIEDRGYLGIAQVHACDRAKMTNVAEGAVYLHPASFYLPLEGGTLLALGGAKAPQALRLPDLRRLPQLGKPIADSSRWFYLVRLIGVAGQGPPGVRLQGPSWGLALAIAACAARCGMHIHPLAATGEIEEENGVLIVKGVAGIEPKAKAVAHYRQRTQQAIRYLTPSDVGRLDSLFLRHREWLTDGFSDYRRALGVEADSVATARLTEMSSPQWSQEDRTHCDEIAAQLFACESRDLICPFDNDPQQLADRLLVGQFPRWRMQRERLSSEPVFIPLNLAHLPEIAQTPQAFQTQLPRILAHMMACRFGKAAADESAFASALATPGKLVLLLHDEPSSRLWEQEETVLTQRRRFLQRMENLQSPCIVRIFSDRHHFGCL